MRKYLFILLLYPLSGFSQLDPLYNQYFFNQAIINPAYSGIHNVFNVSAISRTQWAGVDGSPTTNTLSITSSAFKDKVGLGSQLIFDSYGINSNTEFNLSYAYKIKFDSGRVFSFGLQGGIINYNYDFQKLNLEYIDDEALLNAPDKVTKPNFGLGGWYMGDNYYIGLSVPRVFNIKVNDGNSESIRYRRHMYLSAGYVFDQLLAIKFKPSMLFMYVDDNNYALDLNASFLIKEFLWAGVSYRNLNTIGLNTQLRLKEYIRFGYAFELPLYDTALIGYGTHSLMISFDFELFDRQAIGNGWF